MAVSLRVPENVKRRIAKLVEERDTTPHAFYADYRPSYRKDAAEDGWKRMQEWFRKYGVA